TAARARVRDADAPFAVDKLRATTRRFTRIFFRIGESFQHVGFSVQLRAAFETGRGAPGGGRSSARALMECTMRVRASGSFRRYSADGRAVAGGLAKLRDDAAALEMRFHGQRFRSIDQAGSAVSSVGWTRGDGTVPARFDADELWLAGKLLVGALRIDKKQLPSGALRVRRMEAEAAERRNAGERIAPARRREIVEKIEGELMARMVPSTAVHQMLWRAETGELLLNATSESANVAFRALFRETFEV